MLTPDELRQALTEAQKAAGVCKPWCRVVSTTEGGTYALAHNGLGERDTDTPRIHNPAMTGLSKDGLTEKLRAWIVDLHSGNRIDLNATMATGGPESFIPDGMLVLQRRNAPHGISVPQQTDPHAHSIAVETGTTGSLDHQHAIWTTCFNHSHLHLYVEGSCNLSS